MPRALPQSRRRLGEIYLFDFPGAGLLPPRKAPGDGSPGNINVGEDAASLKCQEAVTPAVLITPPGDPARRGGAGGSHSAGSCGGWTDDGPAGER